MDGSPEYFAKRVTEEVEIFPSEEDAHKFAVQLKEAFKFLKYKGGITNITVSANQSKLATLAN